MNIYIRKKYMIYLFPIIIFLLIIFSLKITAYFETCFSNNNNTSNKTYLQDIPYKTQLLIRTRPIRNYKNLIKIQSVIIPLRILFFFPTLLNQCITNQYEVLSCIWLFLMLRLLLVSKQHKSSYKDFLTPTYITLFSISIT